MNLLRLGSNGNLKNINLNALPPEAWTMVTGGEGGNDERVIKLYETIPWLHRGVNIRQNALAGMPFALHTGDEDGDEIEKSEWPIEIDLVSLIGAQYKDYILYGRSYTFVNKNIFNSPVNSDGETFGIQRMIPASIRPIEDPEGNIIAWKRTTKTISMDIPRKLVANWYKPPVRTENGYDVSDAMVAAAAGGVIRNSDLMVDANFKNGGINTTLIWDKSGNMTPDDKKKVESWFEKSVSSLKNAFKYRVVGGEFGSTQLGYPLKDLVVTELTNSKREDIATALGIPQSLLFSNATNFATAQQDDLHFYDKTIIPDGNALAEVLNKYIFHPLGVHLKFHPERMEIYQKIETDKADSLTKLVKGNIWTVREARKATAMPEDPAEDDPQYEQFTMTPAEKQQQALALAAQMPPKQLPATTAPQPPNADEKQPAENPMAKEMKTWQVKALNRYNEGKIAKALDFDSEYIPSTLKSAISGALEACKSKDAIRAVFADAIQWESYP